MLATLLSRLPAFSRDEFEPLALAAFAWQFDRVAPYRALCERRGVRPGEIGSWTEVPMVPVAAFRDVVLAAAPPVEIFRSSGTTGGGRSVHHHPFPDLYRAAVEASFPGFCLPRGDRPPMLALVAPRVEAPDSSLAFMVDHVVARFGGPGSAWAFGARGLELARARSWLGGRQRDGRPVLLLATAFALADLLDGLERLGLRFRLAPGSALFVTGGFKGRRRALDESELAARLADGLGLPPEAVVGEYGMTEMTSQCYTRALLGGRPDLFVPPAWVRFRVVDPVTLAELPPGQPGLLTLFDLANLGSAAHLLTEDLARAEGDGFCLLGRAAGAEPRGCSLAVEELSGGGFG